MIYDYSSSFKSKCLPTPNDESIESDKISYSKWIEADNKMKILMLGYMVDSLIVSYMNYPSAKSIDDSLEMKFGKKSSAQEKFITSKLSKWEDAHQHMINMIALANEIAIQESLIDDKNKNSYTWWPLI